jgi:hypothetical protein
MDSPVEARRRGYWREIEASPCRPSPCTPLSLPENESVEGKLIDEINRAQLNWNKNRSGKRKTIQTLRPMLRHRSATRFAQRNKMNGHGSDLRRIGFSSSWKIAKVYFHEP